MRPGSVADGSRDLFAELSFVVDDRRSWKEWLADCADYFKCDHTSMICWPPGEPDQIKVITYGASDITPADWAPNFEHMIARASPLQTGLLREFGEYEPAATGNAERTNVRIAIATASRQVTGVIEAEPIRSMLFLRKANQDNIWTVVERATFKVLLNALCHTLHLQRRIRRLELETAMATEIFNRAPRGIIVLNLDGSIGYSNQSAKKILDDNDGVRMRDGKIDVDNPRQHARLYEQIGLISANGSEPSGISTFTQSLDRPSGKAPYQMVLQPLDSKLDVPGTLASERFAAMYIHDPANPIKLVLEQLVSFYGLTNAQATLAGKLYKSDSIQHAARDLGISVNTARTHLRKIYSKVGVRSHAEFQRELANALKIE